MIIRLSNTSSEKVRYQTILKDEIALEDRTNAECALGTSVVIENQVRGKT